jgi:hypothetical protein
MGDSSITLIVVTSEKGGKICALGALVFFRYGAISARGRLTPDVLQLRAAGHDAYRRHWPGLVGLHVPARSQFGLNPCPIYSE